MIEKDGLFKLEQLSNLPYEKPDNVWVSITVERSLAVNEVQRTVYTGFDFLSDVGGLAGILYSSLIIVVGAWNHNSFDNFMSANLFRVIRPPSSWFKKHPSQEKQNQEVIGKERIKIRSIPNCVDFLKLFVPKSCHCCRITRRQRILETARCHLK